MIDERDLRTALRDIADRDEPSSAPSTGLVRRGRRARVGRAARTAGAFGVAGAVLAGVTLHSTTRAAVPGAEPVPLALAAQTTAQTTFHVRLAYTMDTPQRIASPPWDGKYDPVHDRGFLTLPEANVEQRQIGPDCYLNDSAGRWHQGYGCWRLSGSPETGSLGDSANPGELLAQLKRAGNVTYAGRTGSVDTYRFSYSGPLGEFTMTKSGTVDIDVTTRRIVKVSYRMSSTKGLVPVLVVITLDDFGTPVDVAVPKLAR
jgi:hypothetical protein